MGAEHGTVGQRLALRYVSIHGHSVGYRRGGSGPSVLLIHGLAGSSKTWDDVMPILTAHCDVIAVDLLGHGESAKPRGDYSLGAFASGLRDFLSVVAVDSVTIVGHSFGGGVAMQLAYQHPHLVDRLVLVASGGLGREVSWVLRVLTLPGAEYVMPVAFPRLLVERATGAGRRLRRHDIHSPRLAEVWRTYSSLAGATNRKAFVRTMRNVIEPTGQIVNATDRLYLAGHVPTMIVWGDNDRVIPVEHAHIAHELIPTSRLEILSGVGHFPHVEQPDMFANLLVDFIATTDPASTRHEALRDVLREGS